MKNDKIATYPGNENNNVRMTELMNGREKNSMLKVFIVYILS